jgi:DNA-binding transcriptional regulator YdaS (Cro superfamily)
MINIQEITKGKLTVRKTAELCGLTVQAIYKWEKSGQVPSEYCRKIEIATDGAVTRYDLRPDVFGTSPECTCAPAKEAA